MITKKRWSLLLAGAMGVAVVVMLISFLGVTPALASEGSGAESVYLDLSARARQPGDEKLSFTAYFTDDLSIEITDLSGTIIGEGRHGGRVTCNRDKCNQKTSLTFTIPVTDYVKYEFKFSSRQAIEPEAGRVVVSGAGTISSRGQKESFLFTATFENNRDGTVWIRYEASRPDASFIVPEAPGTFSIVSKR